MDRKPIEIGMQDGKARHDPRALLAHAEACLEAGAEGEARDAVLKGCSHPGNNPHSLRSWAELCRELGMARRAGECYRQALRLNSKDAETLYGLALLLADVGDYEGSIRHLKKAVRLQPDHPEVRRLLAQNYGEMGMAGRAQALIPKSERETRSAPERYFPPSVSERDKEAFVRLFAGKEAGYALQQIHAATGETSLLYRDAPLSGGVVTAHLLGDITLAAYPLRSDNTAGYGALGWRPAPGLLEANVKNRGFLLRLEERMRHHLLLFTGYCKALGLPVYPEQNGQLEFRLWLFFAEFTHFLKIRRVISALLENAPEGERDFIVEPLLATRPVGIGWIEQAVLLPLGIDRSTLRRSLFLNERGEPAGEQLKWLKQIRPISLKHAVEQLRQIKQATRFAGFSDKPAPPLLKTLLNACPVLDELARKARRGHVLRREEKVIVFYSVGLLDGEHNCLHSLLETCPDYDYAKVRKQAERLKPNPVSCHRIRELIPEITASLNCRCSFDLRGAKYPSPLLHINPHLVPAAGELISSEDVPVREAARRYASLRGHLAEVQTALKRLEARLARHLDRTGGDSIRVDDKTIHRDRRGAETYWRIE